MQDEKVTTGGEATVINLPEGALPDVAEAKPSEGHIQVITSREELEEIDDQSVLDIMGGVAIQKYVYSFTQGKGTNARTVVGLTLAGVNQVANKRGGIDTELVKYERTDTSWLAVIRAIDTVNLTSRLGAYEQIIQRGDTHAFTKAMHKAQRNAIKQLLPVPLIEEFLAFHDKEVGLSPSKPEKEKPKPEKAPIDMERDGTFATVSSMKDQFNAAGVTDEMFWNAIKKKYKVVSRADMKYEDWAVLRAHLLNAKQHTEAFDSMVKAIKGLNEAKAEEAVAEEAPKPETEDAIPY